MFTFLRLLWRQMRQKEKGLMYQDHDTLCWWSKSHDFVVRRKLLKKQSARHVVMNFSKQNAEQIYWAYWKFSGSVFIIEEYLFHRQPWYWIEWKFYTAAEGHKDPHWQWHTSSVALLEKKLTNLGFYVQLLLTNDTTILFVEPKPYLGLFSFYGWLTILSSGKCYRLHR